MQTAIFQYKSLVPDAPRGIYITLHGEDRKVYPYELFATLWDERNRRLLCEGVEAECRIFNNEVDCVFFDYKYGRYSIEYKRDSFILSADSALRQLCDDILNSRQTIYGDRYMKSAHAERMVEGLCAMNVHRNYNQSFSTDAIIEKFTFKFEGEYACDTPFVIGIGNRLYRSCFSDWSNELDILRYELEGLVLRRKGSVNLHYEDEPNIIEVKGLYFHDTKDSSCVEVTFTPDDFVGGPILFGYCKRKEVVEKLYRGFMELFSRNTSWFDDRYEGVTWDEFRANAITQLKSQVIEDYLNEVTSE